MKIHCNIAKDLMPLYIDDVLSEESKTAVEEHLTACEGCREYYRRMHGSALPESESEAEEKYAAQTDNNDCSHCSSCRRDYFGRKYTHFPLSELYPL